MAKFVRTKENVVALATLLGSKDFLSDYPWEQGHGTVGPAWNAFLKDVNDLPEFAAAPISLNALKSLVEVLKPHALEAARPWDCDDDSDEPNLLETMNFEAVVKAKWYQQEMFPLIAALTSFGSVLTSTTSKIEKKEKEKKSAQRKVLSMDKMGASASGKVDKDTEDEGEDGDDDDEADENAGAKKNTNQQPQNKQAKQTKQTKQTKQKKQKKQSDNEDSEEEDEKTSAKKPRRKQDATTGSGKDKSKEKEFKAHKGGDDEVDSSDEDAEQEQEKKKKKHKKKKTAEKVRKSSAQKLAQATTKKDRDRGAARDTEGGMEKATSKLLRDKGRAAIINAQAALITAQSQANLMSLLQNQQQHGRKRKNSSLVVESSGEE